MNRFAHLLLIPLLLVAACDGKYPYASTYVSPYEVSARSIPAPPQRFSAEYNRELDAILDLQASLTKQQLAAIKHQDSISPDKMLYSVVGTRYSQENYPALYEFLNRLASDSWRIGDSARDYWKSPRPWYTESKVALHVEPIYSYGYPSGHTTTFGTWAYVLSDLMPQHRDAFFEQAWSVAQNRIGGGAHYPHDIEGGKQLAAAIYAHLQDSPHYREDFATAKTELRSGGKLALGAARGARSAVRPVATAHR